MNAGAVFNPTCDSGQAAVIQDRWRPACGWRSVAAWLFLHGQSPPISQIPSCYLTQPWKLPYEWRFLKGTSTINGSCSMAMLNYQRVNPARVSLQC